MKDSIVKTTPLAALLILMAMSDARAAAASLSPAMEQILAVHNRERAVLKIAPLEWDEGLAKAASAWAKQLGDNGTFEHSTRAERGDTGENLWTGTSGGFTGTAMAEGWASEKADFRYGPYPTRSKPGAAIGHYTQMIWSGSTKIGCALATGHRMDVLVCRYGPAGNVLGEKPY